MPREEPRLVDSGPAFERAGLVHRVRLPAGPGPHPTAVMLHGRQGDENVMWIFARALPARWLLVAPRGIKPDEGGFAWHPRKHTEWPALPAFDEAVAAVARLMGALPELYLSDPQRTVLMGFSQGAATSFAVAMRHPGEVRGIASLVGFIPEDSDGAVAGLAGLPVFMAAGRQDPLVPLERAQASAALLRQAGAALAYHEYDTQHKLNADGMRALKAWATEAD